MSWDHLSITRPHLVYIILGGFTSLFMLCSSIIKERLYIGEATVATLCGIIFGPVAANLINPLEWGNTDIVTIEFSRLVLVVQCFAVGVELPKFYMERHWKSVVYLLLPVMTFGWLVTSLFIWWMVPPLSWLDSLVVAACVTPTDPVLASSVVGKGKFAKRVPRHLRDLLSAESGCNDGMAFPFVYLALYLISDHLDAAHTTKHWFLLTILYECIFGAIFGFLIGYIARHAIREAERRDWIDRESLLAFYFVLSLFCAGAGSILGVDDLLVGFAAGVGFSNDGWFSEKTEKSHVSDAIDLLLNLTYFVFFGTIVPWSDFNNADIGLQAWRLVIISLFIIFFRRIPVMLALKPLIPDIKTWREALFAGHFGPMGVGAIFIALLARGELETGHSVPSSKLPPPDVPNYDLLRVIWPIVCFIVISSIIVHGSSIAVFALGKRINTLKVTMSYTTGEEGGKWMNRLPRLSTASKSQMKTTDTDTEMDMPEFPPGTLPPVGLPNNFLRRQREEEASGRAGSRASSRVSRRRRRRDESVGGPVEDSAIFPDKRPSSAGADAPAGSATASTSESPEKSSEGSAEKQAEAMADAPEVAVYEQGPRVVFEDKDGDVLGVATAPGANPEDTPGEAGVQGGDLPEVAQNLTAKRAEEGQPIKFAWSMDYLKRRMGDLYDKEVAKRKTKPQAERKHEPALAYQFGNTVSFDHPLSYSYAWRAEANWLQIIVEDEDGEVVKTYELPSEKSDAPLSQPLKYLGLSKGTKPAKPAADEAGEASGTNAGAKSAAGKAEKEAEDDKRIRFTIGGEGKRLNKEDFCREVWKLDAKTRKEVVEKSDAPADVKRLATMERQPVGPEIRMTGPSEEREREESKDKSKVEESREAEQKGAERKGSRNGG